MKLFCDFISFNMHLLAFAWGKLCVNITNNYFNNA